MNFSTYLIHKFQYALWLLAFGVLLTNATAADFGVANWGMSPSGIKSLETRPNLTPFGEQRYLIYSVNLTGIQNTRLVYQFKDGQLSEGRFLFWANNPMDVQTAVIQYNQIKAMLTEQYGPPVEDQVLTHPPSATIPNPAQYANELASDRLILKTQWHSPSATLKHQLAWSSGKPHHQIHYLPISTLPVMNRSQDAGM